jgi:hypothetical protein
MTSKGPKMVKESESVCSKCGKAVCECGTMGENVPTDTDTNVANGLPQTQGDSKITLSKEHFKNIVREVMKEEEEYQKIFHKMLGKFGVKSPADLTPEQKKKFFTMVKGIQTELAERAKIKEAEGVRQARILQAQREAEAIKLVNEAADKYFIGNAQLLRKLQALESALEDNAKIVVPAGSDIINLIGDMAGIVPIELKNKEK